MSRGDLYPRVHIKITRQHFAAFSIRDQQLQECSESNALLSKERGVVAFGAVISVVSGKSDIGYFACKKGNAPMEICAAISMKAKFGCYQIG
jgi:hypothetical protein